MNRKEQIEDLSRQTGGRITFVGSLAVAIASESGEDYGYLRYDGTAISADLTQMPDEDLIRTIVWGKQAEEITSDYISWLRGRIEKPPHDGFAPSAKDLIDWLSHAEIQKYLAANHSQAELIEELNRRRRDAFEYTIEFERLINDMALSLSRDKDRYLSDILPLLGHYAVSKD